MKDRDIGQSTNNFSAFLSEYGATLKVRETELNVPCVEIDLPQPIKTLPLYLSCEDCGGKMPQSTRTHDFPLNRFGILVRFLNEARYTCEYCGSENSPDDITQMKIIGEALQFVVGKLDVNMRPSSIKEVEEALR